MASVSISEAARLVGKSRSALYATYIRTGKLSVVQDSVTGKPKLDISELIRVFGALSGQSRTDSKQDSLIQIRTVNQDSQNNALEAELKGALELLRVREEQLAEARERIAEACDREAKMWQQVQELTATVRLIEDKTTVATKKRWWWFK